MTSNPRRIEELMAYFTGKRAPCPHPVWHTVYGSDDRDKNGTRCVICGAKPEEKPWRRDAEL